MQYRMLIHQSFNLSWLGFESSMNAYRYTIVVLPLHHVFGSLDLSQWCLSGFDLPIWFTPFKCLSFPSSDVLFSSSDDLPTGIFSFLSCITHGSLSISSEIFPVQVISCVGPYFRLFSVNFSISSRSTFASRNCNLSSIFIFPAFTFSVPALKETKEFQIITKDSMVISCLPKD